LALLLHENRTLPHDLPETQCRIKGFALKVSFTGRDVKRTSHFPSTLGIEGGHLII